MAIKTPARKTRTIPLWSLAAFILPAAALVYLFIWSQTAEPFSVQTEIRRAALEVERLALDALRARTAEMSRAAMQRPLDPAQGLPGLPDGSDFLSEAIPFTLLRDREGTLVIQEPNATVEKTIWPLPGSDLENQRYLAYAQDLEGPAYIEGDTEAAENILRAMAEGFDAPGFRMRTILARAAFLKRHGRIQEAQEDLVSVFEDVDPTAAPGFDALPFVVESLLHLDAVEDAALPRLQALIPAMAAGEVPLDALELRALADRMQSLDEGQRRLLLRRARSLDLMDLLRDDASLRDRLSDRERFALIHRGLLWLGGREGEAVRGAAGPTGPGLYTLMEGDELTGPVSGFTVALEDPAAPPALSTTAFNDARGVSSLAGRPSDDSTGPAADAAPSGEILRSVSAPAGIQGSVLRLRLTDRSVFERSVASRRVFIVGAAVCLILAMIVLGFATFRAVRREVAAAKARSDFMAAVSHELRTPLASIRMFAELLEEGRVDGAEKRSRFMRLIISNCRRLSAMIENVLDLSRSERGLLRFEPEEIDLKGLLEDLFRDIRAVAEEEGFTMDIEIAPDLPAVRADPTALTRALFNLCDNARKYSGEAKRISIRAAPEDGGAMIAITDSGPGIAAGERGKIFERFQRGREGKAAPTGAGLGLSLAREAVEGCGGRLELTSRKGEGATFTVYLPGLEEADE